MSSEPMRAGEDSETRSDIPTASAGMVVREAESLLASGIVRPSIVRALCDELRKAAARDACLTAETQRLGPMGLSLMEARSDVARLRRDLWDIAGTVVAVCDGGNVAYAQLACMEGSPLVGRAREVIAAYDLSNATTGEAK
jgi:hypothetical protein